MAVIEMVNNKGSQNTKSLNRAIEYIENPDKTTQELSFAHNCNLGTAYLEMLSVKQMYNKETGRQYIHMVQSFATEEVTPTQVKEIAERLIKECNIFQGFQITASVHTNTDNLHCHFIINSVNAETGMKWQLSKNDLSLIKEKSDNLCMEYGLKTIPKRERDIEVAREFKEIAEDEGVKNKGEYYSKEKQNSWKADLFQAVSRSIWHSTSREDFIKKMGDLNYKVNWTDNRKYITFETPDGHKSRNNGLYPPERFTKEAIEEQFAYNLDKKEYMQAFRRCTYKSTSIDNFIENINKSGYRIEIINDEIKCMTEKGNTFTNKELYPNNLYTTNYLENSFKKNKSKQEINSAVAKVSFTANSREEFINKLQKDYGVIVHWNNKDEIQFNKLDGFRFQNTELYPPERYTASALREEFIENTNRKSDISFIVKALHRSENYNEFEQLLKIKNISLNNDGTEYPLFIVPDGKNISGKSINTNYNELENKFTYNINKNEMRKVINEALYFSVSMNEFLNNLKSNGITIFVETDNIRFEKEGFSITSSELYPPNSFNEKTINDQFNDNLSEMIKAEAWNMMVSFIKGLDKNTYKNPVAALPKSLEGEALKEWIKKQKSKSKYVTNKQTMER